MDDATNMPLSLQRASLTKHIRPELKYTLTESSKEHTVVCSDIAADIETHQGELPRCSSTVSRSTGQSEVQVEELITCLKPAIESYKRQQDQTTNLKTNIQTQLAACHKEWRQNEEDMNENRLQHEDDIQVIQSQITDYESEARHNEDEVSRLRNKAFEKNDQRAKHLYMGIAGTALFGFGSLVTSGGFALALLGAEAVAAAVSIGGVHSCSEAIKTLATEAMEKRRLAEKATERKIGKQNDRRRLEQEIVKLEENIGEVESCPVPAQNGEGRSSWTDRKLDGCLTL